MRSKRKLLKVTFPNGKTFCYNNATEQTVFTLVSTHKLPYAILSLYITLNWMLDCNLDYIF